MTHLGISGTLLTDLTPLRRLPHLRALMIMGPLKARELDGLETLGALEYLTLAEFR